MTAQVAQISVVLRVHVVLIETDCIFTKELIRPLDKWFLEKFHTLYSCI